MKIDSPRPALVQDEAVAATAPRSLPLVALAAWLLSLAVPILLVLINVRLVMSPLFVQIEYQRPGFPDDIFGFTRDDRLTYAPYAINYLIDNRDISYLGDLRFEDGSPLFNSRELRHMRDVQTVTRYAFLFGIAAGVVAFASAVTLYRARQPGILRMAFLRGALMTLLFIAVVVVLAVVGWQMFFTGFHELFFSEGTWYFLTSDTLIRLFPEQFWFDAALTIGGLTGLEALAIWWLARRAP
ncbi:MAG: TIGR01906 family membrane protein [Anaerolineae bacterium]|nr:TIGR01906 family membrane protein [Anaerolineae bacterium]